MTRATGPAVVIAGATSGIGSALGRRLTDHGTPVVLVDEALSASHGALTESLQGGLSDPRTGTTAVQAAQRRFGGVKAIVNVLDTVGERAFEELTPTVWDSLLDRNVKSLYAMTRPVVDAFREQSGGRVVTVGSRSWLGASGEAGLSATAAAVTGFTRSLALEIGRFEATANALALAYVSTPEWQSAYPEQVERGSSATAVRRTGRPEEVAAIIEFLLSDDAAFITGQVLSVCGGSSIGKSVF